MASIKPEFDKRGAKIIGLSVDPLEEPREWAKDIEETQGTAPNYPLIADTDFNVSKLYGMLPADVEGDPTERTPAQNATLRNVFVIGPDKKIKLVLIYPMTTGRNFDEVLRVLDSLQLTAEHQVATPAQWQPGEDVIIAGAVTDEQAKERYPDGWETPEALDADRPHAVASRPCRRHRRALRACSRCARTYADPHGRPHPRRRRRPLGPAHARAHARRRGPRGRGRPDGGAALAAVERRAPDAVVLDVAMPGLDGLAVCRRLRGAGLTAPVLLLTARDAVADRVAGLEAGADDYLVKPFAVEELLARLAAIARRGRRAGDALAAGTLRLDPVPARRTRDGRDDRADRPRERAARAAAAPRAHAWSRASTRSTSSGAARRSRTSSTVRRRACAASSATPTLDPDRPRRRVRPGAMSRALAAAARRARRRRSACSSPSPRSAPPPSSSSRHELRASQDRGAARAGRRHRAAQRLGARRCSTQPGRARRARTAGRTCSSRSSTASGRIVARSSRSAGACCGADAPLRARRSPAAGRLRPTPRSPASRCGCSSLR